MKKQTRQKRINKQIAVMIKREGSCNCERYLLPHPPHKLGAFKTDRECEATGTDYLTQPAFTSTNARTS